MVRDATICDTVATSYLASTVLQAGAATSHAAALKHQKYAQLASSHLIIPVSLKTFGAWHTESMDFIRELGRRASQATGDQKETVYLLQRISVAVQRGHAAAVRGSLPASVIAAEDT